MKRKTVKLVDGQEFIFKNTMRTLIIFEELSGNSISDIKTTKDYLQWLYATLSGSNKDTFKYNFDEFIDLVDENPQLMQDFNEFNTMKDLIEPVEKPEKEIKKKQGKL